MEKSQLNPETSQTLILGLGNDLLADDGAGILVAEKLGQILKGKPGITVESTAMHGIALLDLFIGYHQAILIDAIKTGENKPGSIHQIDPDNLRPVAVPSPHFTGLPEMLVVARELGLDFPENFRIVAIEVENTETIGGEMTEAVKRAIPEVCQLVLGML